MTRDEVIEEVEYYRDTFKTMSERAGRLALSLRNAPTAKPAPPQPRDAEGFAPEPARPSQPAQQNGDGETMELDVDCLHVTDDGGKKFFKVKGGAFRKWGVFIWPEVLERDFGMNADDIKPGLHPFKYRVRILMDGDKPKKVVGIVQ